MEGIIFIVVMVVIIFAVVIHENILNEKRKKQKELDSIENEKALNDRFRNLNNDENYSLFVWKENHETEKNTIVANNIDVDIVKRLYPELINKHMLGENFDSNDDNGNELMVHLCLLNGLFGASGRHEVHYESVDNISVITVTKLNEVVKKKRKGISQKVKDDVWNRDGGKCIECGSNESLEFDHIIPFSKGGADTYRNIQILCEPCNRKKSNKIG